MFSIPFLLSSPPGEPVEWHFCISWRSLLHSQHNHLEISKELFHCTYFTLLFVEGLGKTWYAYTAAPLLVLTVLAILSAKGGN